jgi:translation initiation factor RLI1
MEDLKAKLEKESKKMEVAEKRRKLELEGYSSDLSAMKKKIVFYQKYIAKMKKAVEEERGGGIELMEMSDEEDGDHVDGNQMDNVSERSQEEEGGQ